MKKYIVITNILLITSINFFAMETEKSEITIDILPKQNEHIPSSFNTLLLYDATSHIANKLLTLPPDHVNLLKENSKTNSLTCDLTNFQLQLQQLLQSDDITVCRSDLEVGTLYIIETKSRDTALQLYRNIISIKQNHDTVPLKLQLCTQKACFEEFDKKVATSSEKKYKKLAKPALENVCLLGCLAGKAYGVISCAAFFGIIYLLKIQAD